MCNLACVCSGLISHPLTLHDSPICSDRRRSAGGFRWVAVQRPPVLRYQLTVEYLRNLIISFAAGVGLACRLCVLGPTALAFKGSLFMAPHSKLIIMQQLLVTACPSVCGLCVCVSLTVSVQRHARLLASTRWPSYIITIIVRSVVQRWDHSPSKYTCLLSDLFFHWCERPSGFISCCTVLQCHVCSHYPDQARENVRCCMTKSLR